MKLRLSLPWFMLCVIFLSFFSEAFMPLWALRFFLTLSLLIKSAIVLLLPFIIWGLLFSGMNQIVKKKNGLKLLFLLIPVVCFSNFLTSWFAYFFGSLICVGEIQPTSKRSRRRTFTLLEAV